MNLKQTVLIFFTGALLLGNSIVHAQTPALYWGAGYSSVNFTTSPFADPADPTETITAKLDSAGAGLKAGLAIGDWLGLEIQYGIAKESSTQPFGFGDRLEIQQGAAFARFNFPFPRVNLYALGGIAIIDIDTGDQSSDENYYAVGLGLDLMATERHMLYLEAVRYEHEDLESDDPYMNVYTIGYKHHYDFAGIR